MCPVLASNEPVWPGWNQPYPTQSSSWSLSTDATPPVPCHLLSADQKAHPGNSCRWLLPFHSNLLPNLPPQSKTHLSADLYVPLTPRNTSILDLRGPIYHSWIITIKSVILYLVWSCTDILKPYISIIHTAKIYRQKIPVIINSE